MLLSAAGADAIWRGIIGPDPYVQLWHYDPDGERLDVHTGVFFVKRVGERMPYSLGMELPGLEANGLLIETTAGQLRYAERWTESPAAGETVTLDRVPIS